MKTIYRPGTNQRLQILGVSLAAALLTSACAGNPPVAQIAVAKAAVNNASAAGANEFAPLPLRSAQQKMEAAQQAMATEDYQMAPMLTRCYQPQPPVRLRRSARLANCSKTIMCYVKKLTVKLNNFNGVLYENNSLSIHTRHQPAAGGL